MHLILLLVCVLTTFLELVLCLAPVEYPVTHSQTGESSAGSNPGLKEILQQVASNVPQLETENCCSFVDSLFTNYPQLEEAYYNASNYIEIVILPMEVSSEPAIPTSASNNMSLTLQAISASISMFKNGISCRSISLRSSSPPSGYYTLTVDRGSVFNIYCDMEGGNCGGNGGWMRVASVDMAKAGSHCPEGLNEGSISNGNYCGKFAPNGGCASTTFPAYSVNYTQVCGRVRGFYYGSPNAFESYLYYTSPENVEGWYVDGISVTRGHPRNHIWTYAAATHMDLEYSDYDDHGCPCNSDADLVPAIVGEDYYCDSGSHNNVVNGTVYPTGPLWDGEQCGVDEGSCCNSNMPWFLKTLDQPTSEDIELRVCTDIGYPSEDILITEIELYVR